MGSFHKRFANPRGVTMTDVMFLMMIIGTIIVPLFALFPSGRFTLKKARRLQTAVFVARQEMNTLRLKFPEPEELVGASAAIPKVDRYPVVVDNIAFTVNREMYLLEQRFNPVLNRTEPSLIDVVIRVEEGTLVNHPVSISTRLSKSVVEMQKL